MRSNLDHIELLQALGWWRWVCVGKSSILDASPHRYMSGASTGVTHEVFFIHLPSAVLGSTLIPRRVRSFRSLVNFLSSRILFTHEPLLGTV